MRRRTKVAVVLLTAFLAVMTAVIAGGATGAQPTDDAKGQEVGDKALAQIADQLQARVERETEERERKRSRPEAVAQREQSRDAFAGLADADAKVLARESFTEAMTLSLEPGPDLQAGEKVDRYLGDTWAAIDRGDGKTPTFAQSTLPMVAENEDGDERPVDLSLVESGDRFAPANPLVDVEIGRSVGDGVLLPHSGVRVAPIGSDAAKAEPQRVGDSRVFWANVQPDTDYFLTPTAVGAEGFLQVRSEAAPEQFALRISIPEGARLRDTGTQQGVEVVRGEDKDEKVIARIGVPLASDADGEPVKVTYLLEGDVMTLSFPHRGKDLRYPLLVDPPVEEVYDFSDPHAWGWNYAQSGTGGTLSGGFGWGPHGYGLLLSAVGTSFPAGRQHDWYWQAPPGAFLYMVDFGFVDHIPSMPGDPSTSDWATEGILNMSGGGWEPGAQSKTPSGTLGPSPWSSSTTMSNSYLTHCQRMPDCNPGTPGSPAGTLGNRAALYQWWIVAGASVGSAQVTMLESRIKVADFIAPAVTGLSRSNPLSGWVDESHGPQVDNVTMTGTDGGLGVAGVEIDDDPGRADADGDGADDDALNSDSPGDGGCDGTYTGGGPCPASFTPVSPLSYGTDDLADGINTVRARSVDAVGNVSAEQSWQVKLDKGGPAVSLDDAAAGDLYERRNTTLTPGSYTLYVHSTDGSTGSPSTRRSGVKKVEVYLGYAGQTTGFDRVYSAEQTCPADSCARNDTWVLNTSQVAGGQRTVKVVVTDQVGNKTTLPTFDVTVPAAATLLSPGDGTHTSKLVPLQVKADVAGLTTAQLQYRKPLGIWQNIPTTMSQLTDQNGVAVTSSSRPFPTSTVGATTALVRWDVPLGFGLAQADGPLEFRAVVSGGPGGVTRVAQVTVDQRGLTGDNARQDIAPGSVDLVTGNFSVSSDDVSIDSALQTLTFARTFNSRDPSIAGPLGPGWVATLPIGEAGSAYKAISEVNDPILGVYTNVVTSEGTSIFFYPSGGTGYDPQPGEEDLELTKPSASTYELRDSDGNSTIFERQTGATEFSPRFITSVGDQNTSTISYQVVGGKPLPIRIVAPAAAGVSCTNPVTRGCRSLDFIYAGGSGSAAAATGTAEAQWGSVSNQVDHVDFTAWDPPTGVMKTDTVASYLYDNTGKLRAEWDPRDTPVKKIRYSYASGRIDTVTPPGEQPWTLSYTQLAGDSDGGRLTKVTRVGTPQGDAKTNVVYRVPVSGVAAPYAMGAADVAAWGQTNDVPADATAVFDPDVVPAGSTPTQTEYQRSTIHYTDASGREVNAIARGGAISTTEHDGRGNIVRELSASNRQAAMNLGPSLSAQEAQLLDTERTYNSDGTEVLEELGPRHAVRLNAGQVVSARSHTTIAYDENAPQSVSPKPHLPTTETTGAKVIGGSDMVDARVSKTDYDWPLRLPKSTTVDPGVGHLQLTHQTLYDAPTGLAIEKRMPISPGGGNASAKKTIYYTAGAPAGADPDCINRPEWANLRCKVKPALQSGVNGLPDVAVTTYTYNRLNQTLTETEKVGTSTRTKTRTYGLSGRLAVETTSASTPVRQGLVAAYGFDEGAGTVAADSSGKNNPGTVTGATWTATGKYGGALNFDGVDDWVTTPEGKSIILSDAMTVEAWVKPDVVSGKRTIVTKQSNGQGNRYGIYAHSASGGPAAEIKTSTTTAASSSSPLPTGTWSHVAEVYDGQSLKLFVNGALKTTQPATGDTWAVGGPLRIGGNSLASEYFDGTIDDVRVYNRPLSGAEVYWDKQTPVTTTTDPGSSQSPEDSGLAAGYDFEEGSGPVASDMSGNGNDATASGGTSWAAGVFTPFAASFDGTDDVLSANDTQQLDLKNKMTIEAWVKLDTLPVGTQRRTIVAKLGSYYLHVNSSGQLVFAIDPTGTQTFSPANEVTAAGPTLGQWTYVAGVLVGNATTGTQLQLYKGTFGNVTQVATKNLTANAKAGASPLRIGAANTTGNSPMDGMIDEVRLWDRSLTLTELQNHSLYPGLAYGTDDGGTPIRQTSYSWSTTTGRLSGVSASVPNGTTTSNTVGYDNVGRQDSYVDADGNTSTTTYDIASRVDIETDGKGSQDFGYDATRGLATSMVDSQAGTFGVTYDLDENIIGKTYPGGLQADILFDAVQSPTSLVYTKGTVWFSEQVDESIHGQWRHRDSTLSDQDYTYDNASRLTRVADTVTGQGCKTRTYTYDANSNRQTLQSRNPGAGGACDTTSTPTIQTSFWDFADRNNSAGFVHDIYSRATTVPASHAGGSALQTSYYVNDMVRSQTQGGVTKGFVLDADKRRYRASLPNGAAQEIYHYADDSDSPAWTAQTTNGTVTAWERDVSGIDGGLVALVSNNGTTTTVTLQLENLHGDITATATTASSTPTATFEADEYGVPKSSGAGTYAWLGAHERPTRFASGVMQMGVRSYVPGMGGFTSADLVEGGSAAPYVYGYQDPVNSTDLSGCGVILDCIYPCITAHCNWEKIAQNCSSELATGNWKALGLCVMRHCASATPCVKRCLAKEKKRQKKKKKKPKKNKPQGDGDGFELPTLPVTP